MRETPLPGRMGYFVQQILDCEAARETLEADCPVELRVLESLRRPLSALCGTDGFRVLLARASMLAKVQSPPLQGVEIKRDGSLEGISQFLNADGAEAGALLLAHLLSLLVTFIGEAMVIRLVVDIWPDFTIFDTGPRGHSEDDRRL